MKGLALVVIVAMLTIVVTGCTKSNPRKEFVIGNTTVHTIEYLGKDSSIQEVRAVFETEKGSRVMNFMFNKNQEPILIGEGYANINDLKIYVEIMRHYSPNQ